MGAFWFYEQSAGQLHEFSQFSHSLLPQSEQIVPGSSGVMQLPFSWMVFGIDVNPSQHFLAPINLPNAYSSGLWPGSSHSPVSWEVSMMMHLLFIHWQFRSPQFSRHSLPDSQ